jgi:hypothetical protein
MSHKVVMVERAGRSLGAAAVCKLAQEGFQVAVLSSSGKRDALGLSLDGIELTGSNQSSQDL